jgi:hypothetical protein
VNLSDFPLQEGSRVVGLRELYATDPELPRAVGIDDGRACFTVTLSVLMPLLEAIRPDVGWFIGVTMILSVLTPHLSAVGSDVGGLAVLSVEFVVLIPHLSAVGPDEGWLVVVTVLETVLKPLLGAI